MRHHHAGRKLGVDASHRVALLRSLALALIEKEQIKTTPARAKELRWTAERLVTLAKRADLPSRRRMIQLLGSTQNTPGSQGNRIRSAIHRVFTELVPRFKSRNGGYTRILRLVPRRAGDNAELCVMQYLPAPQDKKEKREAQKDKGKTKKKEAAGAKESDPRTKPLNAKKDKTD